MTNLLSIPKYKLVFSISLCKLNIVKIELELNTVKIIL